jgi:hypothetical protein
MPTYLYECPKTEDNEGHGEFEEYHSMSHKLEFCPKCKEEGKGDVPVKRLINSTSVGVVALTGHEYVASIKSSAQQMKKEIYASEKRYANFLGDDVYQKLQTNIDNSKK